MSEFSKQKIFQDGNVSAVLDRFMYEITEGLPEKDIDAIMCLTGRAAALLQGAAAKECNNIVFITNDPDVFDFIKNQLPTRLKHTGCAKFAERILFNFGKLYIEAWSAAGNLGITTVQNICVQHIDKIPANTL